MTDFLQRVEPYLLDNDPFVQKFAIDVLKGSDIATAETTKTLLRAIDGEGALPAEKLVPWLSDFPINDEILTEITSRIQNRNKLYPFYVEAISEASAKLLLRHRETLEIFVNKKYLDMLEQLTQMTTEELWSEFELLLETMEEEQWFNAKLFKNGTYLIEELKKRNALSKEQSKTAIAKETQEKWFTYRGIFHVYIAGEMGWAELAQDLAPLLHRDEDLLQETVKNALIKMGGDEVVHQVNQVVTEEMASIYAIPVLEKIKRETSTQTLLNRFEDMPDLTSKTMTADALCAHLAVDAIPQIVELMEDGYDDGLLDLELPVYGCCKITGFDHPELENWRRNLEERARRHNENSYLAPQASKKVGRNDPCPCGSGKKYKKCCGKN